MKPLNHSFQNCPTEGAGDVISGENIRTIEGCDVLNFEVDGFSSFRDLKKNHFDGDPILGLFIPTLFSSSISIDHFHPIIPRHHRSSVCRLFIFPSRRHPIWSPSTYSDNEVAVETRVQFLSTHWTTGAIDEFLSPLWIDRLASSSFCPAPTGSAAATLISLPPSQECDSPNHRQSDGKEKLVIVHPGETESDGE